MKLAIKRVFMIVPAVLLESLFIYVLLTWLMPWAGVIEALLRILSVLLMLFIISYRQEGTYKILWLLFFSVFPIPATVCYMMWGNKRTVKNITKRLKTAAETLPERREDDAALSSVKKEDERITESLQYITGLSKFPAMPCETAEYYPLGEKCWEAMLAAMRVAKKYIYLEYFIIQNGTMWAEMTEVMAEKVKAGVDVRVIYDDLGSIGTFGKDDTAKLETLGIKWLAFNEIKFLTGTLNNRSHRKMLIIDGETAFSGGINLADEYINKVEKYGHWKDIGFKITGPAVYNYLYMFAQFWNAYSNDNILEGTFDTVPQAAKNTDGVILSYYDSPANRDAVSDNFYIEMLGNAKKYAWFYTPYLMLGDTLMDAFVRAAKRGVDVRIIMPGVPDKKLVFRLSRSYYEPLLEAGIKIYQYTQGFVHAKASLYDDEICTIGTVNLDYRSLFLHFENNSVFWHSSILSKLKRDYLDTLTKCKEIQYSDVKKSLAGFVLDGTLRIFAPLC